MLKRSLGLCFFLVSQVAVAQPVPVAKPAPPAPGAKPAGAPSAPAAPGSAAAAPDAPVTVAEPTLPQVNDDMLAAVPPATNVLQSWRDALRLLRQNSSTLRTLEAQQDVARAGGRARARVGPRKRLRDGSLE